MSELGDKIRQHLDAAGVSQGALAERIGVTSGAVNVVSGLALALGQCQRKSEHPRGGNPGGAHRPRLPVSNTRMKIPTGDLTT